MTECPNPECYKKVEGHQKCLFGDDGMGGIVGCLKKMLTKKQSWIFLVIILLPLVVTGIKVWSGQESNPFLYATKSENAEQESRIIRLEEQYKNIISSLKRVETLLNRHVFVVRGTKSNNP